MGRLVKSLVVGAGLLLSAASPAWAVFLDFNMDATHPAGASLAYAGGAAPLIGTMLSVDLVQGNGTPANAGAAGVRGLFGGRLDFTTGAYAGDGTNWLFGPGGSFVVTGGVDLNNNSVQDGGDIAANTVLLTGTFTGNPSIANFGTFKITGGAFTDVKDETLANFYGLAADGFGFGWEGGFNLSFVSGLAGGSAFNITPPNIGSGDIVNTPPIIPEPTSMLLLGLGMLGGIGSRRRQFSL